MFLLTVSYIKPPAQVEPEIKAHGEWISRYLDEGIFLFAGPKKSGLGGVIAAKGTGALDRYSTSDGLFDALNSFLLRLDQGD